MGQKIIIVVIKKPETSDLNNLFLIAFKIKNITKNRKLKKPNNPLSESTSK